MGKPRNLRFNLKECYDVRYVAHDGDINIYQLSSRYNWIKIGVIFLASEDYVIDSYKYTGYMSKSREAFNEALQRRLGKNAILTDDGFEYLHSYKLMRTLIK